MSRHPLVYVIEGCGSREVNGEYSHKGTINERPYYEKSNSRHALWYFTSSVFPSSLYCGWYISKQVGTSTVSSADDYYTAYVHGDLPPSKGWVTRHPGYLPTCGCGYDPPPKCVESLTNDNLSEKLNESSTGFSETENMHHRYLFVDQAGCPAANGLYAFECEVNDCPSFRKVEPNSHSMSVTSNGVALVSKKKYDPLYSESSPSIWYFGTCPLNKSTKGRISYNGWYISKDSETSSYSAGSDMYTVYGSSQFVPINQPWVTRHPGVGPTAGCGISPAPTVTSARDRDLTNILEHLVYSYGYSRDVLSRNPMPMLLRLLNVALPNGSIIKIPISEYETVDSLRIFLDINHKIPVWLSSIALKDTILPNGSRVALCSYKIQKDDVLVVKENSFKIETFLTDKTQRRVLVIGAGPVGLWIAIHIKSWRPFWYVECREKRLEYSRSHALRLEESAFEGMMEWFPGMPIAAELHMLKAKWMPRTRTSIVEAELRQLAICAGVNICYGEAVDSFRGLYSYSTSVATDYSESSASISKDFPDVCKEDNLETKGSFHTIVCCDGAQSVCRSMMLRDIGISSKATATNPFEAASGEFMSDRDKSQTKGEYSEYEDPLFRRQRRLGSLLQVKFDAHGIVQSTSGTLSKILQNLPAEQQFFNILAGNFDSSRCATPMTVFALLNSDVEAAIEGSIRQTSEPSAITMEASDGSSKPTVFKDLKQVLAYVCPSGIVEGTTKISVLPMEYKISRAVACKGIAVDGSQCDVFLAGDAAMGLPFEKGLNYGWQVASRLARLICFCDDPDLARGCYESYFERISEDAVLSVLQSYQNYIKQIKLGSTLRSVLSVFHSHA